MKGFKVVLIVILCGLCAFLFAFLGIVLARGGAMDESSRDRNTWLGKYELVQEKEVPMAGIETLHIQYERCSSDVFFYEGTGENIVIKEYLNFEPDEAALTSIELKGDTLWMKREHNNLSHFFFGGYEDGYTEIYLPAGFAANMYVATASGDIWSEREFAQCSFVQTSSVSGDIYLKKVAADTVNVSTASGNITFDEITGQTDVSSVSGDVMLRQVEGDVKVSATSGNIYILGGEGSREASAVSGDIRIDGLVGWFDISTTSGNVSVQDGIGFGIVDTISGDARIFLKEMNGDLSVGTTSGDVSLQIPEDASFCMEFDSNSGECNTFFDDVLSYNEDGNHAEGSYGEHVDKEIGVSTVSGDLRVTSW